MNTQATNSNKSTSFKVSEQVKKILHRNGLSRAFNFADYQYYKAKTKNAFNKAHAIAQCFIEDYQEQSDLNEYQF